jgi:hypothetical protein
MSIQSIGAIGVNAPYDALPANQPNGQDPLDQTTTDQRVNRASDRHRTGGHPHHHHHAPAPATSPIDGTDSNSNGNAVDVRV